MHACVLATDRQQSALGVEFGDEDVHARHDHGGVIWDEDVVRPLAIDLLQGKSLLLSCHLNQPLRDYTQVVFGVRFRVADSVAKIIT